MSKEKYIQSFFKYNYGDYLAPKKMKVVLIYTGISGESFFNSDKIGWEQTWHYPGFQHISECLKIHNFSVELIDFRELSGWMEFQNKLEKLKPDVVGFTAVSCVFDRVKEAARITKESNPNIHVVVGGVHVSIVPEDALEEKCFDTVIMGEGDISFVELMYEIEKSIKPKKSITGKIPNLDELPFMDRNLFRTTEDPGLRDIRKPYASVVTSRGCPFNCTFCQPSARIVFGNKVRQRSVNDLIEELVELKKMNVKSIRILDDLFILNKKWLQEFLYKYKQKELNFQIICQCRADMICKFEDIFQELSDIGLTLVHIGLESGSQRILDILNKGVTVEENYKSVEICNKLGIKVFANYIFGIPGETKEDMQATIDMLNITRPEFRAPNILFPTIGSELYYQCVKEKSLINYDIKLNSNDSKSLKEGFIKNIDYKLVEEMYYKSIENKKELSIKEMQDKIYKITNSNPKNILIFHSVRNQLFNKMIKNLKETYKNANMDIFIQKDEIENFNDFNYGSTYIFNGKYFDENLINNDLMKKLNHNKYEYIIIPTITQSTIGYKNVEEIAFNIKHDFVLGISEDNNVAQIIEKVLEG